MGKFMGDGHSTRNDLRTVTPIAQEAESRLLTMPREKCTTYVELLTTQRLLVKKPVVQASLFVLR